MNRAAPLAGPSADAAPALADLSLEDVLKAALASGNANFEVDPARVDGLADLPTRFPIQVDPRTRVFLEYHAMALGTSIAALSGLILKHVVEATLRAHHAAQAPQRPAAPGESA